MDGNRRPRRRVRPTRDGLPELFTLRQWQMLAEALGLSPRQMDTARLLCRGLGGKDIARQLHLSPHTVRMHLRDLYERLNVRNRVEVVVRLVVTERRLNRRTQ